MQTTKLTTGIPNQPATGRIKHLSIRIAQYFILMVAMFIFAGHENTNPKIGDSYIDFYTRECQQLLEIQSKQLLSVQPVDSSGINFYLNKLVTDFYKFRKFQPAWTFNFKTTENFDNLHALVDSARYFGFPENYINFKALDKTLGEFNKSIKTNDLTTRIRLEMQSTREMFVLLIALNKGIIYDDSTQSFENYINHLAEMANNAISSQKLFVVATNLQPEMIEYKSLIQSLPEFIALKDSLSGASNNLLNDSIIAHYLYFAGILKQPFFDSTQLRRQSIENFQQTYKLNVTGKINSETKEKLGEILQYRYYQICLNLDRLRKLNNTEDNYLFVNIPEYKLHLIEHNKETELFNIIVGKEKTPTPQISSKIDKIITNPCWTVPRTIAIREMLSKIRKDSTYLQRNGYIVVDNRENPVDEKTIDWSARNPLGRNLWIRQKNSKHNALGVIKFLFPNEHQVYLHDTPGKQLFKKNKRAFSHGCIRLQNPVKLAQLFSDGGFISKNGTSVNIKSLINKKGSSVIELKRAIQINITYVTCITDEKGNLIFLNDIYRLDEPDINLLFSKRRAI